MENFFNLLMAEMKNQDPLEPMSNTEFISQLANFTALKAQQDALYYQNANYAQSLVGKTVTVATLGGSSLAVESGIVTSMSLSEGQFMVKVNGKDYALSSIMEVLPSHNPYTITGNDGAYATSLIGKQVTVVGTDSAGRRIIETGTVNRIEIADNQINIIMDGLSYPLSSVIRVEDTESSANNQSTITAGDWAHATSLIGKLVTVTEPHEDGKGYVDTGIVTRVEVSDNQIKLIIDGQAYPLAYVTKVQEAPQNTADSKSEPKPAEPEVTPPPESEDDDEALRQMFDD
jgi:flagellar basal-body rod modification protein FlgD